jgi:hypothetical protein
MVIDKQHRFHSAAFPNRIGVADLNLPLKA